MLFSPVHARSANIYTGILAASGLRQEQSRGRRGLLALLNPSALGKRGMGKGGTAGDPATAAVGSARATVPRLQLSVSLTSTVALARPPPCPAHRVFAAQGSLKYNLGKKASFLQQTVISEGSFQPGTGRALPPGETECPTPPTPPGNWGLQWGHLLIYFWVVCLKMPWESISAPRKNLLSRHFPSPLPPLQVPGAALQTWLASAGKWELPQQPGSRVRNSHVCWGRSAYSTL